MPKAIKNAKQQNDNSITFLSTPGKVAHAILKKAAVNFLKSFKDESAWSTFQGKFRSTSDSKFGKGLFAGADKKQLYSHIQKISTQENMVPQEIAGLIATIGDVMGLVGDYQKNVADGENEKVGLAETLNTTVNKDNTKETFIGFAKRIGKYRGGSSIAKNKTKERGIIANTAKDNDLKEPQESTSPNLVQKKGDASKAFDERKGQFNLADDVLIPKLAWPYQTVPEAFVKSCETEPFAGHYSGSIGEMLAGLEWFANAETKDYDFAKNLDGADKNRTCIAALASATLIRAGYHSAIEVLPAVRLYLGDFPTTPASDDAALTHITTKWIMTNDGGEGNAAKCKALTSGSLLFKNTTTAADYMEKLYAKCQGDNKKKSKLRRSD